MSRIGRIGMRVLVPFALLTGGAAKLTSQTAKLAKEIKPQQIEVGVPDSLYSKFKKALKWGKEYTKYQEIFEGNHFMTLVNDKGKNVAGYDKRSVPLSFEIVEKNGEKEIAVKGSVKMDRFKRKYYKKEIENPNAKPEGDTLYFPLTKEGTAKLKMKIRHLAKTAKHNAGVAFRVGFNEDIKAGTLERNPDLVKDIDNMPKIPKADGTITDALRFFKIKDGKNSGGKLNLTDMTNVSFHQTTSYPNMINFDTKTNKLKGKALN